MTSRTSSFVFVSLLFVLLGCVGGDEPKPKNVPPRSHASVRIEEEGPTRAVVLVLHGLNVRPERMDELGRAVAREGATVHRGALSGHGGPESYAALARITRRSWIDDFRKLCRAAAAEADAKRVPLRFLGFSLGSLIAMDTMVHDSTVRFDRMVHLAPAVAPRRAAYLSRLLRKDWSLGSRTPAAFRVHDRLPAAAYHALLDSVEALEESGFAGARSHALNVATLVFIDPADELVSPRAVRKTIRRHELDHWRVVEVSAGASDYPHHLLLAREGFEAGGYAEMVGQVSAFLTE